MKLSVSFRFNKSGVQAAIVRPPSVSRWRRAVRSIGMNRLATLLCATACVGTISFGTAFAGEAAEGERKGIDFSAITASIFNPSGETRKAKHNSKFSHLINRYARKHGVPSNLAHAIVRVESNFNPRARGRAGEVGLMQIKLGTARQMGYRGSRKGLYDPETNIKYGMKYLAGAHKLSGGDTCGTVLRYNAGHGAKRMNPISSRYCKKVRKITG